METPTYNLGNLVAEAKTQLPHLFQERSSFLPGFKGDERIPARMRLAVQLRAARLMGCPVCAKLFPPIAGREGLSPEDISNIVSGDTAELDEEIHGAVTWVSALIANDGEAPDEIPEACLALSEQPHDLFEPGQILSPFAHPLNVSGELARLRDGPHLSQLSNRSSRSSTLWLSFRSMPRSTIS